MANNFSDYIEGKLIDHLFQGAAYTAPTNHYLRLWTATLADASTPATAGEVSGGSYAGQAAANSSGVWTKSGGQASNTADITYPTATANWGTATDTMDTDNTTAGSGNSLFYGTLTASKTINSGDVFKWPAASYVIALN